MARAFVIALALIVVAPVARALSFDRYHEVEEIGSYLRGVAAAHPSLARFRHLGYSERGREISLLILSKHDPETLPAIYLNGAHHGNEKSSTETVLALIEFLVANRAHPDVAGLLDSYALYLHPVVNPDGHVANSRGDAYGRDPNRDYAAEAFRSRPIRIVKELVDKVRFRAAAAFHSGMEGVLWPWCSTPQKNPDHDLFYTLSKVTAGAMRMNRYMQSYMDYPTRGEFIDYVYAQHGTMALTVEVSKEGNPPAKELAGVVQRAVAGAMAFMLSVQDLDRGKLVLERAPDAALTVASGANPAAGAGVRVE